MAKLSRIVLYFDDGTEHEVVEGYNAVYTSARRAERANEKAPWDDGPPRGRGKGASKRDMGKDDSNGDLEPQRCYMLNGTIICP